MEVFELFMGGRSPLLGALSIIERWNSGNLPILVANTYGINFIKIGGIWTFHRGQGGLYFTTATLNLTLTFISELDLDIVLIYHCATKKVSIPSASKVRTRTDTQTGRDKQTDTDRQTDTDKDRHRHRHRHRQTDRHTDRHRQTQTDRHTRDKNFTSPHTRAATMQLWRFHWYHHETLQYNLNRTKMKMLTLLLIRKFLPNFICCLFQSN